jgi:hypothetical protein
MGITKVTMDQWSYFKYLKKQYWPGSRLGRPILSSAPLRGGGAPLCIGKQEVGTYIYIAGRV